MAPKKKPEMKIGGFNSSSLNKKFVRKPSAYNCTHIKDSAWKQRIEILMSGSGILTAQGGRNSTI